MLKVFEAFAGYGSQRMALRNLGIEHEVVAISEFDKYADASYQAIHGETWNMGDITKIDVAEVPDHDLFTYSFPCQDISVAGKGKGFSKDSGTRSGLLWESERIIKAKKPKYLLMENVKNLISEKFMPGFVEWILALEELGYSNYYEVLNAKDFGIPQNRERVFMVSILGEHEPYVFPKPIKLEKRLKDVLEDEVDEKYYLDNEKAEQLIATITEENNITESTVVDATVNEPKVKEVMNTITARYDAGIDNYKSIGGAVVEPKIAASRGRNKENPNNREKGQNLEQRLEINEHGTSNTLTTVAKDNYVLEGVDVHPFSKKLEFNGYKQRDISPCLLATDYKAPKTVLEGIPIKNAVVPEVIGGVGEKNFGSQYRQGNRVYDVDKIATTLTASPVGNAGGYTPLYGDKKILTKNATDSKEVEDASYNNFRIRKLTPKECWRLMGCSDEDFHKAEEVNSNTQLYKQAGNSIVVSVLEAIFRNMFLEVPDEDLIGEHIPLF